MQTELSPEQKTVTAERPAEPAEAPQARHA